MGLFDKLFGTRSQRELKKIQPIVDQILALEDSYKALSEQELKDKTIAAKPLKLTILSGKKANGFWTQIKGAMIEEEKAKSEKRGHESEEEAKRVKTD